MLLLLHALIGTEDDAPRNAMPQFSRLSTAMEELDRAYSETKPTPDELVAYIEDAGGVEGLYDLARLTGPDTNP